MKLSRIYPENIDTEVIREASEIIRNGGLVIFPTETVYGIAVDAFNPEAVLRLFGLKGRKFSNPLTLHLADKSRIKEAARNIPPAAEKVIERYLPGPVTVIFEKRNSIPGAVTAGKDTVGIRVPDHAVASAFIRETGAFVAASSANFSGGKSPESIEEIPEEILDDVELVIDSGKTEFGVHSTVIDFSVNPAKVLREGSLSKEKLEKILGLTTDAH